MRRARNLRERAPWPRHSVLRSVLTPPGETVDVFIHVVLALASSVTRDGGEVSRVGNLGFVDILVVRAEHHRINLDVVVTVDVVQSRDPYSRSASALKIVVVGGLYSRRKGRSGFHQRGNPFAAAPW